MKRNYLLIFLVFLSTAATFGQDFVVDQKDTQDSIVLKNLTLIPFQNKYYRSEIDRSLGMSENINYQVLRDQLRKELDRQLFMILSQDFEVTSFLKNDNQEGRESLDYIFYGTASSFTVLENDEEVERNILEKGQIKEAPIVEGQRYMKTLIHHPPLLSTINEDYPSDYFLFIGELDILLPTSAEKRDKVRYIYVHYTLYNLEGEIVNSGLISQEISARKCKKIKDISLHGFAPLAYQFKNLLGDYK